MRTIYIFLDDERFPNENTFPDAGDNMISICRMVTQARSVMNRYDHYHKFVISFDHDLGANEPTGYDFAKWLVESDMDGIEFLNEHFEFYVHSQNPIGKANIEGLLNGYLDSKRNLKRENNS